MMDCRRPTLPFQWVLLVFCRREACHGPNALRIIARAPLLVLVSWRFDKLRYEFISFEDMESIITLPLYLGLFQGVMNQLSLHDFVVNY